MSGPEISLGLAPIAFKGLIACWKLLDKTLTLSDDADDLMIRLERARGLTTVWASQSGLSEGALLPALLPFEDAIARTLTRISSLIKSLQQDGNKYDLATSDGAPAPIEPPRKTSTAIMQMRRSLHAMVQDTPSEGSGSSLAQLLDEEAVKQSQRHSGPDKIGLRRRVSWAAHDRAKFQSFVGSLEKHISGLGDFLHQAQMREMQLQLNRLDLQVVDGLSEVKALLQLQVLSSRGLQQYAGVGDLDVACLAEWKALTLPGAPSSSSSSGGQDSAQAAKWNISTIDPAIRARWRFLQRSRVDPDMCYLFEKKDYDANIPDPDKDMLRERIRKLVLLLGGVGAQRHLHTLKAVSFVDDPELHCWWIIFQFPIATGIPTAVDTDDDDDDDGLSEREPLSLRALYSSPQKPALEIRYRLAKRLTDTFARLYGSAWMHKSVNSSNIVFPHLVSDDALAAFRALETALVQGFGYSRQHTEAQTIDHGRVLGNLEAAIYRHPNYQGEAASGYQVHYDIYSLGLVLFEIALWAPLMGLLAAKSKPVPGKEPPSIMLSPEMTQFYEAEARELKRRVDMRVEAELAYRVGTKFRDVVQWCLNLPGPVTAIEFYDRVAVPLEELSAHH
ncbi:hypothetical protein B0T24DRAFT_616772 [Lasiosphaeria ovina]|uniref:Prion-inhibition and propagation HeLo domain-containing protein n=1 Tax=Lasiosphaeria ovina TaxID=92902 RepID=A0AAE0KGQ6_9PEZI|nr:hypothetical protein B0T24DRAFT_616772 [Lasiosphaeria ovina]